MPLYDYGCKECDNVVEVFHKMNERYACVCVDCKTPMTKLLTTGAPKLPDPRWIDDCANGAMNDLSEVQKGRQERITTREQARAKIKHDYRDPYPRASTDDQKAANSRVRTLRTRYLERY